jgi:hypothetical protein
MGELSSKLKPRPVGGALAGSKSRPAAHQTRGRADDDDYRRSATRLAGYDHRSRDCCLPASYQFSHIRHRTLRKRVPPVGLWLERAPTGHSSRSVGSSDQLGKWPCSDTCASPSSVTVSQQNWHRGPSRLAVSSFSHRPISAFWSTTGMRSRIGRVSSSASVRMIGMRSRAPRSLGFFHLIPQAREARHPAICRADEIWLPTSGLLSHP